MVYIYKALTLGSFFEIQDHFNFTLCIQVLNQKKYTNSKISLSRGSLRSQSDTKLFRRLYNVHNVGTTFTRRP